MPPKGGREEGRISEREQGVGRKGVGKERRKEEKEMGRRGRKWRRGLVGQEERKG